ncbi:hypothetical protein A9D14_00240 [Croceicoccus marinus]|uniref:Uncharacterized protein n=1 Tax=Croceicoccus marinus TaxID=450378 RepID=A0A1Z1F7V3_9SPHN|nr:hypothetical protein A9D14_00240 [Croceicoccus marinus]
MGRPFGAGQPNGSPVIFICDTAAEEVARIIIVGALAPAIFRDPANSAPGGDRPRAISGAGVP